MTLLFPSLEFDDVVAAVCHGSATEAEMRALNDLLRRDFQARDEYLLRIEVHTRLASEPYLFLPATDVAPKDCPLDLSGRDRPNLLSPDSGMPARKPRLARALALAACLLFIAGGAWFLWFKQFGTRNGATSKAVAMLARTVDARWSENSAPLRAGSALEPSLLRLEAGLAQVVFYSGARIVLEGPVELRIVSPDEAICTHGRLLAEIPPPARGFRLKTGQLNVVDLGTSFGIDTTGNQTEVHVFKGRVELLPRKVAKQSLDEGQAVVVQESGEPQLMAANATSFTPLFEFQKRFLDSESIRYDQWRLTSAQLNQDPSLVVHLDFETLSHSDGTLPNMAGVNRLVQDATIVGCQRAEGRWREKQALEFQSVNDRVRLAVPGEFNALTLSAWVCVKGLDRPFNSLFMCDGFKPGTIHWLIRNDGVLGLTVISPAAGNFQILASPRVVTLDTLGQWLHLAVVLDGPNRQVIHYVNGNPVSRHALKQPPPFRLGSSELGNWNAQVGPNPEPVLIRNLSGSLDEFELFSRALNDAEIRELCSKGKP